MTANRRSVRKRRSKHKGSMKIITLIVLVLCGVFGVFTWQNTQKSEQYALVQENLQQQIDDEEENQKAIEEQAEYQKTDAGNGIAFCHFSAVQRAQQASCSGDCMDLCIYGHDRCDLCNRDRSGHHEYREDGNGRYRKRSGWIYVPVYHICGAEGDCSWHCASGQRYYGPG